MKKLLYIAPVIIDLENLNGVSKKILNHLKVFSEYFDADMISYGPDCLYFFHNKTVKKISLGNINRRLKLHLFIKKNLLNNKYPCIYIRYHLSDFLFIYILKKLKCQASRILIEIPSYPYKNELLKWKNGILRYSMDFLARGFLKFYVDRIVTYSDDRVIYGIETLNTINGVIFDDITIVSKTDRPDNQINLISVSVTMECHGYDRLINGINNYYEKGGTKDILYHLVGTGSEINRYRELIKIHNLSDHIILYGFKTGKELDEIYEMADIAVNSIAIHRIGLEKESTIKSKEYSAKGLPMISSYDIDTFSLEENLAYVFKVSQDDTPIDIEGVIAFYQKIYSNNPSGISEQIRNAARMKSDMVTTLKGVIEYFQRHD